MLSIQKYVNYLRKDEIIYELDILGISTAPDTSVDALRKQLRQIFKLKRRGSIKCAPVITPLPASELKACTPKIAELEDLLSSGDLGKDSNLHLRVSVRANYLIDRLARLEVDNASLVDLRHRLIRILAQVEQEDESSSDELSDKEGTPKCSKTGMKDVREQETDEYVLPISKTRMNEKNGSEELIVIKEKPINLNSLNLKYNGSGCVRSFIERLEELRQAREIPQSRMLTAFSDLLEDSALAWFRSNKANFNSYSDLLLHLREDFDIPDLDYRLKNEIRQRTQARQESIVSYISTMQGMFARLSIPMSLEEQLEILMHNIRPEYMKELALHNVDSILTLKQLGKRLELAQIRAEKFTEPNLNKLHISNDLQSRRIKNNYKPTRQISTVTFPQNVSNNMRCMRCQSREHFTRVNSREILCFKCGKKGVRRPECPQCNPRLADSGASCSILGKNSHLVFQKLGFKLNTLDKERIVKTANSTELHCVGYMSLPIEYNSILKIPYDSAASAEKTAFTVPRRGLFQFNVMCFGLVGASATMQRLMDKLFGPEFDNKVFAFQDDIICISNTFSEHIELLESLYQRLKDAGLTINKKKSQFCRKELKYLGYYIDKHGLRTDPGKVDIILNYPTPSNPKEVKRFLGMAGWYRRFVNNFSEISKPLCKLTRKNVEFEWNSEAQKSINLLKTALVSAPILKMPDYSRPFRILTDASAYSAAAVLTQSYDGVEHPIAYCSRSLNKNEVNYSTTERELLAVIYALEQFRQYVEGQECTIVTDHASLLWFYKLKNPTGRLARWSMRLSQFNFKIEHRKGRDHILPDTLSRIKLDSIEIDLSKDSWYSYMLNAVKNNPRKFPNFMEKDGNLYRYSKNKYDLTSEFDWKLVVPEENRSAILRKYHDDPTSAHLGVMKTHRRIALHYYWPHLYECVKKYVSECETCKQYKPVNTARPGLMGSPKKVTKPFEAISCDLLGPFPNSRNRNTYLIVVSDYFSKYVMLHPIRSATGMAVANFIEKYVFLVHGVCKTIFIDNGPQYVSSHFRQLLTKYNVPNIYYNPKYHPQTNQAERANRNIVHAIACYVKSEHRRWDEHLIELQCALNTAVNEATKFSPYFLVHGREYIIDGNLYLNSFPPCPLDQITSDSTLEYGKKLLELNNIFQKVRKYLIVAHQRNEKQYNLRKRHIELRVGQIVYKRTHYLSNKAKNFSSKLAPKFIKCVVTAKLSPLVYTLTDLNGKCLGFLSTGDKLAPGNNGFRDQVVAMQWVQRNIRAFGGDPNLVTIAGCSAGSISVMLHMVSPMSKGLFHRGISMSASPMGPGPLPDNLYDVAVKQARLVGCPTDNSTVIMECLKNKPWRELGDSLYGFREWGFDPVGVWPPVVERDLGHQRFLTAQPADTLRRNAAHTTPHLISQTTDEFFWSAFNVIRNESLLNDMNANWERVAPISFQLPAENSSTVVAKLKEVYLNNKPLKADEESARALGKIYGDAIVGFPTHRMANLMCRHSPHKVFYYEFAYIGNHSHYEDPDTGKPIGAAHHDDLIYLFSLSYRFPFITADDENPDSRMVDYMTHMWYNFAKHGDPNPLEGGLPSWPAMFPKRRHYLRVASPPTLHENMFEDRFTVWDELYPIKY
ncbi:hypothetical protein evm_006094 [Chilo suppressalis]|nr:hypothetical protein evm_006094 [Chilo suppressalis]